MRTVRCLGTVAAIAGGAAVFVVAIGPGEKPEVVSLGVVASEKSGAFSASARATSNAAREVDRDEHLQAWADGIALADIPAELERIERLGSTDERVAARRALLFSWTSRDLVGVARWVGMLGPAYGVQQTGREQIVEALLQCNPEEVVPALRESLPESTSRQLLGPYFRAWAATEPMAAAGMLVRLAVAERRDPRQWHDLIGQVSAQWMASEPTEAMAWMKALPESEGKSAAIRQACYRWTEIDPVGVAAYAAQREDPVLVKIVAAKWAEAEPAQAMAWARRLPEGTLRQEAMDAALAIVAQ